MGLKWNQTATCDHKKQPAQLSSQWVSQQRDTSVYGNKGSKLHGKRYIKSIKTWLVDTKQLIAIKDDFNLIKLHILQTAPLRCSKQCHLID